MTRRRIGLSIALLLLGSVVVYIHALSGFNNSFVEIKIRDSLHVLGFAGIAAVVFELARGSAVRRSAIAIIVVLLTGLASEAAQAFVGRTLSVADLGRDLAGATFYLLARNLWRHTRSIDAGATKKMLLQSCAGLMLFALSLPFLHWSWRYVSYQQRTPLMLDSTIDLDANMIMPLNAAWLPPGDAKAFSMQIEQRRWTGLLVRFVANDWSAYDYAVVRLSLSGSGKTSVQIDLSDGPHPGYRMPHRMAIVPIGAEYTDVRISLHDARIVEGRPDLDLRNVERLWLTGKHDGDSAILRLDKIWLE